MTCLPKLENLEGSAEGGNVRGTVSMVISRAVSDNKKSWETRLFIQSVFYFTLPTSTVTLPRRMPPRPNARVLRDIKARQGVADNEISRRAYLYVARNHSLPAH